MPTLVEVPEHGTVEFPEGMSAEEISGAIQKNYPDLAPKREPINSPEAATAQAESLAKTLKPSAGVYQPSNFGEGTEVLQPVSREQLVSAVTLPFDATRAAVGGLMEHVVEPIAHEIGKDVFMNPPEQGESIIPEELLPLAKEKGVVPALTRALQGMTTEGGLLTLPMAALKPVQAMYEAGIVSAIPDSVQKFLEAKTPEDRKDAATELGVNVGMAALMARGKGAEAKATVRETLAPETTQALKETGGTDAVTQRQEPVSNQPEHIGISPQRQAETPSSGNSISAGTPEQAAAAEVLANPTPAASDLLAMTPEQYVTWKKQTLYGPESPAKIAAGISADDIAVLEAARDEARKSSVDSMAKAAGAGDNEAFLRAGQENLKAQTLNEIIDSAKEKLYNQQNDILGNVQTPNLPAQSLSSGGRSERSGTESTTPSPGGESVGRTEAGNIPSAAGGESGARRRSTIFELIDKRDRRNWSSVPSSFEQDAVRAAFNDVKGLIPKSAIRQRVKASKATTFKELREALSDFEVVPQGATEAVTPVEEQPPAAAPEPAIVGMGGATPEEFKPTSATPTSIKNAQVDVERQQRGLPPAIQPTRKAFGAVWDQAMAKIDHDPGYQDRLIAELRDNPRALTDVEDATLLHRQIDLQNEYGKATRDLAQAYDDGRMEDVVTEQARVEAAADQLHDIYDIGKKVGTETGRGLAARRMMANEDFTLAKMEMQKRAEKGGAPLTPDERAEVTRLHDKIAATQKAYDDYVAATDKRIAEMEVDKALQRAKAEAAKEPTVDPKVKSLAERIVAALETQADAASKRLRERLKSFSANVDPTILADVAIIGSAKIARGALDFGRWSTEMVKDFGEKIKPFLQEGWDAANKMLDSNVTRMAGPKAEKVKRAVKGTDIAEQTEATKADIKKKLDGGADADISKSVQKLARLFVESGIKDRDALIDAVHNTLKEFDPEITRREAMDAISGYGKFKQLTKDDISLKLRDLKGQMQQVAKLEDMQAGQPPLKTGIERRVPSDEERRLIKAVNEAKNQFQIPISDEATQLKSSLDTLKTKLRNQIADWEDRLKRGDFEKRPKRVIQMDAEANRLHFENAKAKAAWHEALMKDRLAKRSTAQKVLAGVMESANLIRAIKTSFDFSAFLRQAGPVVFSHPIMASKELMPMFRAFKSKAAQHALNQEVLGRKNYPLYNQSKLYLAEHGQKLSQMEEAYMSRWAEKIPGVAASERAYTTVLNRIRADAFDALSAMVTRAGETTPESSKVLANYVNVATGRGNIGMRENALVGMNSIFFAPRYVASRFQLAIGQPLWHGLLTGKLPLKDTYRARVAIAKEYARFLAGVGIVYALGQAAGAHVETDPRSSDFGKMRWGNTRLDPMAGLLQVTTLLSRLATGKTKKANNEIVPIRGKDVPYGGTTGADVIANFTRTKLAPVPGEIVNVLSGKNVVGQTVTPGSEAANLLLPLSLNDIYQVMKEQGVPAGTALSILSIFGMGLQTYDTKKK